MRIAFVTLWDGQVFGEMERLAAPGKQRYCTKYNFDYVVFDSKMDSTRRAPWSKIRAVQKVLKDYDWVVWHDTDTVLWNDLVGIEHFFETVKADFIVQDLADGLNSGVFLIRNCRWSESFLTAVYDQTHLLDHPYTEQQAICELIRQSPWIERAQQLPHPEAQNGFHGYYLNAEWDKLFVHFAGLGDDRRPALIENITRLAGYQQHLRALTRSDFPGLLTRLGLLGSAAEIGAGRGAFASMLLERWGGRKLHLIDGWKHLENCNDLSNGTDEEHADAYRECVRRTSRWDSRVRIHRAESAVAAQAVADETMDFVRLDANPSYDAVGQDIKLWWPKVKPGGILFGSNYLDGKLAEGDFGVRSAVREFERQAGVAAAVTTEWSWASWYVIKPSKTIPNAWHSGHPFASGA